MPGIIGSTGWDLSRAWIWLFSSTHRTTAPSGGLKYNPTTSNSFSTNSGSVDSLNVSTRWGLSSNLRQIRPILDLDSPVRSAIDLRDQWVASLGVCSKVATTTSSTWSTVIDGGRPGRGSSTRPSKRSRTNRDGPVPTVGRVTDNRCATSTLDRPSAHANTIRHRNASTCDDFARRDHRTNVSRSSSVNVNSAFGRPVFGIQHRLHIVNESQAQDTSTTITMFSTAVTSRGPGTGS